jgi:hypothetical protein
MCVYLDYWNGIIDNCTGGNPNSSTLLQNAHCCLEFGKSYPSRMYKTSTSGFGRIHCKDGASSKWWEYQRSTYRRSRRSLEGILLIFLLHPRESAYVGCSAVCTLLSVYRHTCTLHPAADNVASLVESTTVGNRPCEVTDGHTVIIVCYIFSCGIQRSSFEAWSIAMWFIGAINQASNW